jgi:hypothetical protein
VEPRRTPKNASTGTRSLSIVLLAIHFVVLLFSSGAQGAIAAENGARTAGHRALVTSVGGATDEPAVVSGERVRIELGTRPRGHRVDRRAGGDGPALLDAVLPRSVPAVAPPARSELVAISAVPGAPRSRPSIVNGARGPPPAR